MVVAVDVLIWGYRYSLSHILSAEVAYGRNWEVVLDYLEYVESQSGGLVDIYALNGFYAMDAITAHIFGRECSTKSLVGRKEHRDLLVHHYRDIDQAEIYLVTDLPRLMEVVNKIRTFAAWLWGWRGQEYQQKLIGGTPIRDWAWKTWESKRYAAEPGIVAPKLNALGWKDTEIVSELMVCFYMPTTSLARY